jgi:hypothetical protein
MKVALILASNTSYAPYMYHYIKMLKEQNIDYDIIIWNKDNVFEEHCISYNMSADLNKSRLFRIKNYFGYSKFVQDVLKNGEYKKVIVFTIFLGILLYPYLKKKFQKLYFFDIRDYSPILIFLPWIVSLVINNSYNTTISSPGFLKWLPKSNKYLLSHNYRFNNAHINNKNVNLGLKNTILTIGYLRDFEMNKSLIQSFQNNDKFLLKFVGNGLAYQPLVDFVRKSNITNVVFTGAYEKKNEFDYLNGVRLMNILLSDDINSNTLMTNRFYLAVSNGIPVIVNNNSTQGEYVNKYNLGININNKEVISKTVKTYLDNFDNEEFLKGSADFIIDICLDQEKFEMSFKKFIKKE